MLEAGVLSCSGGGRGLDSLWMRDFQGYTEERRGTRRWWLWSLPVVLIALIIGVEVFAGPVPLTAPGHGSASEDGGSRLPGRLDREDVRGRCPGLRTGRSTCSCSAWTRGLTTQEMGSRTDTIMLVRVVPRTGDVKLLSVPRDLYVEVEPGEKDRINAAYNYGGIDETIDALENYSGVPIDHYAVVDFEGFKESHRRHGRGQGRCRDTA